MDDKHLSGEEKRAKMKEEFKKDLMLRKQFLDKVNGLRQMSNINQALNDMMKGDDTDEWMEKLNTETAFLEAKTEIALDAQNRNEGPADILSQDKELDKAVAESMVEKMKRDLLEETRIESIHDYQKENGENDNPPSRKTLGDF